MRNRKYNKTYKWVGVVLFMRDKIVNLWKSFFGLDNPIRYVLFNIITCIGIIGGWIGFICSIIAGLALTQIFTIVGAEIVLLGCVIIAYRTKKTQLPATIIIVAITLVLFPIMFFTGGGTASGMPYWFAIGMVFDMLLLEGAISIIVLFLQVIMNIGCIVVSYYHPEMITQFTQESGMYIDIAQSMLIDGVAIGTIIKFQLSIYDKAINQISNQKKELELSEERANSANQAKSDFLSNMSHEMRTPINAISGMNEMILRECSDPAIKEYAANVKMASNALLSLVNDILDISKIESGKMEIVKSQYELGILIKDCYNLIKDRADSKNLELEIRVDENLPNNLCGDVVHIRQILINLLTNAVKYTSKGSIILSVNGQVEDGYVLFRFDVEDTGMGIKKEGLSEIFDAFQRMDLKKNRNIEGTGLGLSITKQLVELMEGSISVESEYGKGSKFSVELRQEMVNDQPIGNINKKYFMKVEDASEYKRLFEAPDCKVLVVDDNKMNILVFTKLLEATKLQIESAESGYKCLEMTKSNTYDIIFLDHMMPEMDGIETLHVMRDKKYISDDLPVIMLTASAVAGMREKFLEEGFTDYISKPINYNKLEELLVKYLPKDKLR